MATHRDVSIYRRLQGSRKEYRFLMSETGLTALQALAEARRTVEMLRSEFPDYEFILVRGARSRPR